MFKIVICDDQKEVLESTALCIKSLSGGAEFEIETFESGADLLAADTERADLFVLDIGMPGMDGFELAERLNGRSLNAKIIFLTSEAGRVFDGYKYRAFRFVVKGDTEALNEAVTAAFRTRRTDRRITLNIKKGHNEKERMVFNKEQILYFEYNLRQLSVKTSSGSYDVAGEKLADFVDRFSPLGFVFVHRSYLVNMAHISRFDKNDIVLSNGERICIGSKSSMVRRIKQEYFRFIDAD